MKLNLTLLALLLGIAAFCVQVRSEEEGDYADDDAGAEDEDDEEDPPARLISTGGYITANPGDTVSLLCEIENKESAVVQWRREHIPLFFDLTRQVKDTRYNLDAITKTVSVKNFSLNDVGEYSCEILGTKQKAIYHVSLSSPVTRIMKTIPEGPVKILKKGSPLTLMCEATGEPKPRIYWTHKKKHSHKEEALEGETIKFDQVSRKNMGNYTCTADNGIDKDKKTITIVVNYEPEIEVEKDRVNSAEGYESELLCYVHAHPAAKVRWLKDDKEVRESHHITRNEEGNKHILRISNTRSSDFGTYTCSAVNEFGSSRKSIFLSGLPSQPVFLSSSVAEDGKSPVLSWKVSSHSPIQTFELMYKKQQDDKWDIATPTVIPDGENAYMARHTLRDLEPGTYVAQIRAKNGYGWSTLSEVKNFPGDVIGDNGPMQSNLESSPSGTSNLEMRISIVFVLSLFVAHLLS